MRHRVRATTTIALGACVALLASTASPASAAPVVVARWAMNETTGTAMADSSGTGNTGTRDHVLVGNVGRIGASYAFDGATSKVTVKNSTTLNPGTQNFRINLWIKVPSSLPQGDYNVMQKGTSSTAGGHFKVEIRGYSATSLGQPRCVFRGTTSSLLVASRKRLNDGLWHSVSCVKSASSASIVVDGLTTTKAGTVGSISNTSALTLGYKPAGTGRAFFQGSLDEVSITRG